MKPLTRSLAIGTVLGAFVTAPLLSRQGPAAPATTPMASAQYGVLPSDWSVHVIKHLENRPVPVEDAELRAIVCHAAEAASRFGLDPFTVLAIIEVESGFDPYAVSPAEAKGLMQLREATAREVAGRLGVAWTDADPLFDPATNVLLGTAYFRELLDRFGSVDVALAAFHAGPARFSGKEPRLGPVSIEYTERIWGSLRRLYDSSRSDSHLSGTKGDPLRKRA